VTVVFTVHLALLVLLVIQLVLLRRADTTGPVPWTGWFRPPSAAGFRPAFHGLALIGLAGVGVFGLIAALTPAFLTEIGVDASFTVSGLVVACTFAGSAVAQFALKRVGLRSGVLTGASAVILGLVLLAVAVGTGQMWLYILAAVVSGIGQGMTLSRSVAAVSAAAQDVAERVSAVSLFYFLVYLLASVPVVLVGVVQRSAGLGTAAVAFSALSAVVVAVGVALAGRRL
jgi:hypothetical protein